MQVAVNRTLKATTRLIAICAVCLATTQACLAQATAEPPTQPVPPIVGPVWRAVDNHRVVVTSRLDAQTLSLVDVDPPRPLTDFLRLTNTDSDLPSRLTHRWPIRIVTLWTGETFVAQLIGTSEASKCELLFGANRVAVDSALIREIALPAGIRELAFVPGEATSQDGWTFGINESPIDQSGSQEQDGGPSIPAGIGTLRLNPRISRGEVSLSIGWPRFDHRGPLGPKPANPAQQQLHFVFPTSGKPDPDRRVVTIKNVEPDIIGVASPDELKMTTTNVRIERKDGGNFLGAVGNDTKLLVRFRFGDENVLSINGVVAARSSEPLGELLYVRVGNANTQANIELGLTTVWEFLDPKATVAKPRTVLSHSDDCLVLHDGSEVFGKLLKLRPTIVELETAGSRTAVESNLIQSIRTKRPAVYNATSIEGNLATLTLRSIPGIPLPKSASLVVALQSATESHLQATHPILGSIEIPWQDIQHIEPLGDCDYRILRATPLHLGVSNRSDFQIAQPEGIEYELKFLLVELSEKPVSLLLEAADVEPSGPDTLAAQPRLEELRAGHFTTEVWVNDHFNGTLNGHVSVVARPSEPRRIDMAILPRNLVQGVNRIVIKQKPSRANPTENDDCEISTIALKVKR